jgi:hypothetical protein
MSGSPQILIRRVIRLPLRDEAVNPRVSPRLWRSTWAVSCPPRSESPIVHGLEGLQRHASSLSNFRERFGSRIHLSKLLRVGRSFCFLSLVRLEKFIIFPEHLFVTGLDLLEGGESPEIFEGCVDPTLLFTQLPNLLGNLSIAQRHLTFCRDILPPLLYREIGGCPTSRDPS